MSITTGNHEATVRTVGTGRAQYHLRQMFVFLNIYAVNQPEVMVSNAHKHFDQEGKLTDEPAKKLIRQLREELSELDQATAKNLRA